MRNAHADRLEREGVLRVALGSELLARAARLRVDVQERCTPDCSPCTPPIVSLGSDPDAQATPRTRRERDLDLLAQIVTRFMMVQHTWFGTSAELLAELRRRASDPERSDRTFPAAPNRLSCSLRRAIPCLRLLGVATDMDRFRGRGAALRRAIALQYLGNPRAPCTTSSERAADRPPSAAAPPELVEIPAATCRSDCAPPKSSESRDNCIGGDGVDEILVCSGRHPPPSPRDARFIGKTCAFHLEAVAHEWIAHGHEVLACARDLRTALAPIDNRSHARPRAGTRRGQP